MDALIEVLIQILFYGIGRLIVTIVSLGFVRGEGMGEKLVFPWYRVTRRGDGMLVASAGLCALIGGLAATAAVIAAVVVYA